MKNKIEFTATPQQLISGLSFTLIASIILYKGLRRFPTSHHIPPHYIQTNKRITGIAVRVSDSDNFRFFHTPFLWLFGKRPSTGKETIHIRLAGVDAPEGSWFGMPEQPLSKEAKEWLKKELEGRRVSVELLSRDQYGRIVGMVWRRTWWGGWRNTSLEMLRVGLACVYRDGGKVYGGMREEFEKVEEKAKVGKRGIWGLEGFMSPSEHKKLYKGKKNKV